VSLGSYTDPVALDDEIEQSRRIFRRGQFPIIDVTDKPIEVLADAVIGLVSRW
jgi:regulator of PEP synthase PpsR (kinase-PPPase family)